MVHASGLAVGAVAASWVGGCTFLYALKRSRVQATKKNLLNFSLECEQKNDRRAPA